MRPNVNHIPEDLRRICQAAQRAEEDLTPVMPPSEIVRTVAHPNPDNETLNTLHEWVNQQERTWEEAQQIISELPESSMSVIPDWYLETWAFPLRSKWSAGLAEAVEDAKQWLATKST